MRSEHDSRFEEKLISVTAVVCVTGTWFAFLMMLVRWLS